MSWPAAVTFVPGTGITSSELEVTGRVPGISEKEFVEAANNAGDNCPVSKASHDDVEVGVTAPARRLNAATGRGVRHAPSARHVSVPGRQRREICSDHCREMAGLEGHRGACGRGHDPRAPFIRIVGA